MQERPVAEMVYQQMYLTLFNQVSLALDALQHHDYGTAEDILHNAQANLYERRYDVNFQRVPVRRLSLRNGRPMAAPSVSKKSF